MINADMTIYKPDISMHGGVLKSLKHRRWRVCYELNMTLIEFEKKEKREREFDMHQVSRYNFNDCFEKSNQHGDDKIGGEIK